jgi:hypothetical protein
LGQSSSQLDHRSTAYVDGDGEHLGEITSEDFSGQGFKFYVNHKLDPNDPDGRLFVIPNQYFGA